MKKTILMTAISLFVIVTSSGQGRVFDDELITVDVTKSYSTMKELVLQDFMDVEYVVLETKDDFLNQGFVRDVGKKFIIVTNTNLDGDIFIYNRSGKALRKINNKGQHLDREYMSIMGITLDEDNKEMFVNDLLNKSILVYDLNGKFKRSFKYKGGTRFQYYKTIYNYDKENLICFFEEAQERREFILISKKDGSVTHEMTIPIKEHLPLEFHEVKSTDTGATSTIVFPQYKSVFPYNDNWLITEVSSDTIYKFLPDYKLRPFIVRTPPIHSMKQRIHLVLHNYTDRYYFMEAIKYEKNFSGYDFLYDKQEKVFFKYTVYNGDFSAKQETKVLFQGYNQEILLVSTRQVKNSLSE